MNRSDDNPRRGTETEYRPLDSGVRSRRPVWVVLLWLFVSAFAVRVIVSVLFGENNVPYYEYMTIADNLLHGRGYSFDEWGRAPLQPTSFLPPLYVYWCAVFMAWIGDNYLTMYIAQALRGGYRVHSGLPGRT